MASDATAHAPLAPPSLCASPSRQQMDGVSLQRPFTASGARKTRLLAVQVHWGEHLDRLSNRTRKVEDLPEAVPPSTYVALRATRQIPHSHSTSPQAKSHTAVLLQQDEDVAEGECYELRSPPFATSRVVERSANPKWNELLLVSLPIGWRQQQDAGCWRLHVDVVERDPSQQEDSLLATMELALAPLATHRTPQHLQLVLQPLHDDEPGASKSNVQPTIYVSLSETDNMESPQEVAEATVHELVHAASDAATHTLLLVVSSSRFPSPLPHLRDVFLAPEDAARVETTRVVWISPMARFKPVEGGGKRLQWQFPMVFHHHQASNRGSNRFDELELLVYSVGATETPSFELMASASADLTHVPMDGRPTAVQVSCSPEQTSNVETSSDPPQVKLTVRRWDAHAWLRFETSSVSRRVITTNRRHRKRAELLALEWTGALCRGLNRYPISSFCDEGGISSLLASYLAASNTAATDANGQPLEGEGSRVTTEGGETDARLPVELLNQHIRLLQQEVMAKQDAMHKIQMELEARHSALQRCGTELVVARKEVRARDELVAQLQATIREREARDAAETRELMAGIGGLTGLRLDSQGAQRMNVLIFKYKELDQKHHATVAELADARRAVGVYEQLERKYADLEQAHVVQAALVQRLQKDKTLNADLQKTIRMQEKVIRKFEKAVQQQRHQHQSPPRPAAEPNGSSSGSMTSTDAVPDTPLLAMRVQVLEQQLQVNAKSAASEIGRLKMRIMELETQLSHPDEPTMEQKPHHRRRE